MNNYVQLGDLIKSISQTHKLDKEELVFLNTSDVLEGKILIDHYSKTKELKGQAKKSIRNGDILYSEIRPKNRRYAYVKDLMNVEDYVVSTKLMVLRNSSKNLSTDYLYHFLTYEGTLDYLQKRAENRIGSFPQITFDVLKTLRIWLPEISIQQQIASVLSSLDSKIALNNRINRELEAMAKLIYDYWFVQFDFPDENGKPYKSSGGKMVWSDVLKQEIPEGWGVKELSQIANITMGQSPPGSSYNDHGEGILFFQGSTDFGWRYPETRQYTTEPSRMANAGDILLSVRAPVGTFNLALVDCCIGRGLSSLSSKDGFDSFLFYVMFYLKKVFDRRNVSGTTFGSITKDDLHSLHVVYPTKEQLEKFNSKVLKFNQIIRTNHLQNLQLTSLRDWLLPMLMNGQVRVGALASKSQIPPEMKAFAKQVLAGRIISECHESQEFTLIKLQKLIHLSEYTMEADLDHNYYYQAAGPYDNLLMNTLYTKMKEKQWFESTKQGWRPLNNEQKIAGYFDTYFGKDNPAFRRVMSTLGNASEDQCELISTLYAVWNDRLIKKERIEEPELIKDFYSWSQRKQSFSEDQIKKALGWMRDHGFEPKGFGALIKRKKGK